LIQVGGVVLESTIEKLRDGITIKVKDGKEYITKPTEINLVNEPQNLFSSGYVLHERVPSCWIEITLTEGKFHQVRKMVKAVRHPCKRLIRVSIEDLTLEDLMPGEVKEVSEEEFFGRLKL
jgi:23S rRNA pseudouridine2457 synthase